MSELPPDQPHEPTAPAEPTTAPEPTFGPPSIIIRDLKRTFGSFEAVKGVSLEVPKGAFFGFLGTNGAGKSTTIKMLSGILQPTGGSASLLGLDIVRDHVEVKRRIGVVPEESTLFERLTGFEYLIFVGRIHGLALKTITQRSEELFTLLDMKGKANTLINEYSKGMKKKLALAAALLYNPQVLFLDEPFEGVDVVTTQILRRLLNDLTQRGVTIFLTSHIIEIVQRLCTHFAIIHKGELVANGQLTDGIVNGDDQGRTLEQLFLHLVTDAEGANERQLSWLDHFGE